MEQATTGKAPPPIAINSGGGIQILNMNAVRGATGIGATAVPSPGSAQTGAVVGSPGPPGKSVGPRMISITPQMLANARPGQPVEKSDTKSVNQCDGDDDEGHLDLLKTTNPEPRCSPVPSASITGVSSSDLQRQTQPACGAIYDDKCEYDKLEKDSSRIVIVNKTNFNVTTSEVDKHTTDDEHDLSPSNPPANDKLNVGSGPSKPGVINERSASQASSPPQDSHSLRSPPFPPDIPLRPGDNNGKADDDDDRHSPYPLEHENGPITTYCDENENHSQESGIIVGGISISSNSISSCSRKSSTDLNYSEVQDVDSSFRRIETVISSCSSSSKVIVSTGTQPAEEILKVVSLDRVADGHKNDKCIIYDKLSDDKTAEGDQVKWKSQPDEKSSTSDLGALQDRSSNINKDDGFSGKSTSQLCVQANGAKSVVSSIEENRNDSPPSERPQQGLVTISSFVDNKNSSSVINKSYSNPGREEPPTLVQEENVPEEMGQSLCRRFVNDAASNGPIVDDVNLDMFSDSRETVPLNNSNDCVPDDAERLNYTSLRSPSYYATTPSSDERYIREERSTCLENGARLRETEQQLGGNKPKLMDMNLTDLMFMEDEIQVLNEVTSSHPTTVTSIPTTVVASTPTTVVTSAPVTVNQGWNQTTSSIPVVPSANPPYSTSSNPTTPIIGPPVSSRVGVVTSTGMESLSQPLNPSTYWNKNKVNSTPNNPDPQLHSPPSCAFQSYGSYNQPQQHVSENAGNLHIAARIPMRNDLQNSSVQQQQQQQQQHNYQTPALATRLPHPQMYSNNSNSPGRDVSSGQPPTALNNTSSIPFPSVRAYNNVTNISMEYKANHSQSQQHMNPQSYFTNDPQLHSQFVQYTKTFPLGYDSNKDPASMGPPTAITRAHHAPLQPQQGPMQSNNKIHPIKPAVIVPQQQQHHYQPQPQQQQQQQQPIHSMRQPTGVQQPPRQFPSVAPQQYQQQQQTPQSSPFQSQYRANAIVNGCDNSNTNKPAGYSMPQHVNPACNYPYRTPYGTMPTQNVGLGGQPPTSSVAMGVAGSAEPYYSHVSHHNPSATPVAQSSQQHPTSAIQKDLSSCSYANLPGGGRGARLPGNQAGAYNPSQHHSVNQPKFPGTSIASTGVSTGNQPNVYNFSNNYGGSTNSTGSTTSVGTAPRNAYNQQQMTGNPRQIAAIVPAAGYPANINKTVGGHSPTTIPSTVSSAPGFRPPQPQGVRAQLLQVIRPQAFPNQNLAGRAGEVMHRPPAVHQQGGARMPYQTSPTTPTSYSQQQQQQQQHYPGVQSEVPMTQYQNQQRTASVIAPRYAALGGLPKSHVGMPGGSSENQPNLPPSSTSTSPQMLRGSQYLAHSLRPPMTVGTELGPPHPPSSTMYGHQQQSPMIRPNMYTTSTGNTGVTTISTIANSNSSTNSRQVYGSTGNSSNAYYNNQASVIRAPPASSSVINSSSSSSTNTNTCTINRSSNSCIVIERGTSHHPQTAPSLSSTHASAPGYGHQGEFTLQSFLSHPTAPFMCPSSPNSTASQVTSPMAERSGGGVSGYQYNSNSGDNWGGASYPARGAGENQDENYASLSSCQYSDGAMRRYNAPITLQSLQALSGLPPGANHLLVKTENGQFQLVSVRMQSPTAAAAAPGTPVVPSTVAAPPTSMSIAQQLPSNSPHVAPPLPPPSAPLSAPPPGGPPPPSLVPPLPPPISSSMITTTTIPPHPSAQQGRIITSSSSNHIVTSWSSSNNNSLVNNSTSSSPLPVISTTAAPHAPPPHLAPPSLPPPPTSAPPHHTPSLPVHPSPSVPSSVIMPPSISSASNSQLSISTANNNISSSSASSSTYSTATQAAISAVLDAYQQRAASASSAAHQQQQQHGSVMGPPGGSRQPPPTPSSSNSLPTGVAPAAGPVSNSVPSQAASVIRSGGVLGASSLPPPPPPVVVNSSSSVNAAAAAAVAAVANSVISSSTNPSNSNLASAAAAATSASPAVAATLRPPPPQSNTAASVPNNSVTNNSSGSMGMGMMMNASTNAIMSVQHQNHHHQHLHHHQSPHPPYNSQLHPHSPHQQVLPSVYHTSSFTSNSIVSSNSTNTTTANTVSQMSNETAKTKCKNFLSFLLELSAKQNQTVARNVKNLIQGLIDGKVNEENFADRLQKEVNSQPQPCLVGFLKKSLPHLRHSLAVSELKIDGIKPPSLATLVPTAPVSALAPPTPPTVSPDPPTPPPPTTSRKKPAKQTPTVRPTTPTVPASSPVRIITPPVNSASPSTPPTPTVSASSSGTPAPPTTTPSPSSTKSSKPSKGSSSKSKSNSSSNSSSAGGASASSGPGGTPSSKSSIPSTSKSSKEKEKKDKTFSSGYSADDDINDVAAMGGVNLAEESQRILGSTEYVGTQIRSCRDETLIHASPIATKFRAIAGKYGLDEIPSGEVSALLSHAVEERLKTMIEQLSVIAEHRMDVIKLDERYEITQDVKGQLRFLEELDKLEKKRHDEQEREMLIRAAKSRSKSEDPEQAKLKAKAKEMQRVALEEMRQRDANFTALQAIGPRKKPKLDIPGGSHGSVVPNPMGATGASSSLGRAQMPLRPRLKRVNLRDLLFLLEHDKETMRSPFLYKNLLLK